MVISKISIKNFRSVEKLENLELEPFNVFVGQNNHGKTNIFEAIEWFFIGSGNLEEICFMRDVSKKVSVEIEFTGLLRGLELITNENQKKALSDIFGQNDSIIIKRDCSYEEGKERQLFNPKTQKWENTLGRDSTWKQFLPSLEYINTEKSLEDVVKYGKTTPVSKILSSVLEGMLKTDQKYSEFKRAFKELFGDSTDPENKTEIRKRIDEVGGIVAAYLQKQFPDCVDVKFKVENPELEDLFKKFKTTVDDGIENDSSEKGDGMQRALMLAIIQAYASFRKDNGESKDFLFLIDEAELHLHPIAQRALKSALLEVSKTGDQVLVNTHSSVLVVEDAPEQQIFKVEKVDHVTNIVPITKQEKPYVVYELLGGTPTDLLLPSNILIVEGYSEVLFLQGVIKRFYPDQYVNIQIVPANGDLAKQDKSLKFIEIAYCCFNSSKNPYSDKIVTIVDGPNFSNKSEYEKFYKTYPKLINSNRYFELPVQSLEEYYPGQYKANPQSIAGKPNGKNELAEYVSANITQQEFENAMKVFHDALIMVVSCSFGN